MLVIGEFTLFEWRYYTLCWLRWKNTHRKYQFSHQNDLAFNSSAHFAPSCGALSEGFGLYYWPVLPLIPLESLTLINSKPLLHKFRQVVNYSYDCKAHSRLPLLLWLWGIPLTNERLMEKIRWEINALWYFFLEMIKPFWYWVSKAAYWLKATNRFMVDF